MGRQGNHWGNTVSESFFVHINHETYKNMGGVIISLFQYIEGFYNYKHRHSALGNVSPSQVEEKTA